MEAAKPNIIACIPSYDEEHTIASVIVKAQKHVDKIIVCDDGSKDMTAEIAEKLGAVVVKHDRNRGYGAALATLFEKAREVDADIMVTLDGDGQHNPDDIWPVVRPIVRKYADVVVGSRLKNPNGMPWYRILGIWGLNIITAIFFWVWSTDSQSGLRAFSKKAIKLIDIQSDRMEVSSEFFYEIGRHQLKKIEVPISSIYTKYSLLKGQKNVNALRIISKLIYRRFFSK